MDYPEIVTYQAIYSILGTTAAAAGGSLPGTGSGDTVSIGLNNSSSPAYVRGGAWRAANPDAREMHQRDWPYILVSAQAINISAFPLTNTETTCYDGVLSFTIVGNRDAGDGPISRCAARVANFFSDFTLNTLADPDTTGLSWFFAPCGQLRVGPDQFDGKEIRRVMPFRVVGTRDAT